ncbi:TetR/AcrR family transcriptional regulator [Chroococcidiopsis sp. CCMEE 29]|uniref:TetR/AcrR family transcriptional regulator n=1 Tax=Chroococcidiopsis sp. CCMEE 29 TaxID=155894 RepID=UPI0020204850|nr:TetR/AcrR family transcriptional regulator [Chroococcidiopsis sp. CCMEE 29]
MSRGPDKQFDCEVALSKAMDVFWARGFEAASLSELLEQMGIGRKSLYDTFGNKRSLFIKALEYYACTQIKSMREQLLAPGSPLTNLERVLQDLLQVHSQPGSKGCMLGTNIADFDTSEAEIASLLRHYLQQTEDAYYMVISRAQKAGEISSTANPRDLARMLLCTTQGMALLGRVQENETLLQGTVEATISLLKTS